MKELIKNALILFAITLVGTILLAISYQVTEEPIKLQKAKQTAAANETVMPGADFEPLVDLDLTKHEKIDSIFAAKNADEIVGYTFKLITDEGYNSGLEIIVGISLEGSVTGVDIVKSSETPGLGAKADDPEFKGKFTDKPLSELTVVKGSAANENEIESISGATITSRAVANAVNEAINYYNNELSKGGN
ncbi:MAG: electron transporter RnfG [Firmicutes bacterium HGW-Firmicutes-1]|jgi:electron transport complex protein RnfG|nr:MAG: electron transporter RnfG [Firmicutes bacterium HGW-Firmicutes-1]